MSFYEDASWLLIPSGIEEDIVFAQKPTSGLGDLTFTRASDATYTDSTGVVRRSPYNLFTQSVWTGGGVNVAPTGWVQGQISGEFEPQTAINGTVPYRFFGTVARRYLQQAVTLNANQDYLVSVFVNSVTTAPSISSVLSTTASVSNLKYYINNVEVLSSALITANTTFAISFTATVSGAGSIRIGGGVSGAATYDFVISQPQIVEGTSALDYFPTTNRQDVPRIDFRNADGTLSSCGRLLLEPQRTNSLFYSEEFDNAYFTKSNASILSNVAISPNGQQNADKLVPDTSNITHSVNRSSQSIVGGIYSVFAKADGYNWIALSSHPTASPSVRSVFFNVSNGTIGTTAAGVRAKIENYGNGWYRCSMSEGNSPSTIWTVIATNADNVFSFAGNGTDGVLIWGGQNEQGTYATSYIPTTTAAVTRGADSASKTGVSSLIGQTEGTLFVDIVPIDVTTTNAIGVNNGTTSNRILIFTGSGLIFAQVRVGGVSQFNVSTSASVGQRYKAALAYKGSDFVFYLNGAQIGVTTTGTVPACSVISFDTGAGVSPFVGRNNQAALFPTRLPNATLAQLTTL